MTNPESGGVTLYKCDARHVTKLSGRHIEMSTACEKCDRIAARLGWVRIKTLDKKEI